MGQTAEDRMKHKNMTEEERQDAQLTGRIGGLVTRNKLGLEHYREIGRKGAQKRLANLQARSQTGGADPAPASSSKGSRRGRSAVQTTVQPTADPLNDVL